MQYRSLVRIPRQGIACSAAREVRSFFAKLDFPLYGHPVRSGRALLSRQDHTILNAQGLVGLIWPPTVNFGVGLCQLVEEKTGNEDTPPLRIIVMGVRIDRNLIRTPDLGWLSKGL